MPRFEPFAGLRYASDRIRLDDVVAPPYDVISPEDRAALQARSAYNAVRIEVPDDAPGLDRYQAAAQCLSEWQAAGILRADDESAFYGYRMTFTDDDGRPRHTVGVIGALGIEPPGDGSTILPHEHTTPKAKSDRLQLLRATKANVSPIWGLSLANGLSAALVVPPEHSHAVDAEGVAHDLWPIARPDDVARLAVLVSSAPVLIADGHHRYETAMTYQAERRALFDQPGAYDLVMAMIVELVDDEVSVQAIHRLISGLPPDFDLVEALAVAFDVTPTAPADASIGRRMTDAGALGLLTPAGTWLMRPRSAAATTHDLDSSRLEVALAELPEHEVVYQHSWQLAANAVARGEAQAGVLLRSATAEQIAATGRGGEKMPPKTTFFWPKLRTGLVMRRVPD